MRDKVSGEGQRTGGNGTHKESLLWTIQRLKEVIDKITRGELKQAIDKLGVVKYLV
jgi:hypothetical protein